MADFLTPIVDADGDPVYYPIRSFRSVETPFDPSTSPTRYGWNLEAEHSERMDRATNNEHRAADGIHYLLSVPMVYVVLTWNGATYDIGDDSEDRGVVHRDTVTIVRSNTAVGEVEITLSSALPSAYLWLREATDETDDVGASPEVKKLMLHNITSSSKFKVRRWVGDPLLGAPALADGDMAFYIGAF